MAAFSTGSSWSFPTDLPGEWVHVGDDDDQNQYPKQPPQFRHRNESSTSYGGAEQDDPPQTQAPPPPRRARDHYPARQCRICLETVYPNFDTDGITSALPAAFQRPPRVTYSSPDGGRLLRPCRCKGSQQYVHEECLSAWRMQDPLKKRNYWQCPTCRYQYRLERLQWSKWIGSTVSQIVLTVLILIVTMFILGFVADPVINMYLDPVSTLATAGGPTGSLFYDDEPASWPEHFGKGLATIGLLGFAKLFITIGPWNWFQVRAGGGFFGGNRAGTTGRDRLQQLGWVTLMVGIATFLFAVWKGVRASSRRLLERAGERVMDVPGSADDDDDGDAGS